MTAHPSEQQRIVSLDVLRGFALLGILLMNIQSFSMPGAAYLNPYAYGDMNGVNSVVWQLSHVFADQKFMSIFSLLFGVGVLVFAERIEARGQSSRGLHYRRMGWLLFFGLAHGYLFWYGDILFSYAMCGLVVYLFRNKSVKTLFILGLLAIAISSILSLLTGFAISHIPAEELTGMNESWKPEQSHIDKEIAAYTGTWLQALKYRFEETLFMQTYVFLTNFVWRAGGMMLLGMGLYKSGFFNLVWINKTYVFSALISGIVGLVLVVLGLMQHHQHDFSLAYSMFIGSQFNYWGSLFIAGFYACSIMLLVKNNVASRFLNRLSSVGKTAFSNYILQTILCTGLFYGFGLFGSFERVEQVVLVASIWILQLILAPMWLKRFKFGPLEWLWRSLTYWKFQPMENNRRIN